MYKPILWLWHHHWVHSQSQLDITISLWINMVLRRTFTTDIYQKMNLNIALSLISWVKTNGIPTRHPKYFCCQLNTNIQLIGNYISWFIYWWLDTLSPDKRISALSASKPEDRITLEYFSHIWNCGLGTAKQTLVETKCKHYRQMVRGVELIFRPSRNFMWYRKLALPAV